MGDVQKMLVGFQSFKGRMMVDMVVKGLTYLCSLKILHRGMYHTYKL